MISTFQESLLPSAAFIISADNLMYLDEITCTNDG
jgi:hypothetical protein